MSDLPTYVLERVFDAPRDLVWKTWTDPKLLPRWYGPKVETIIHRLDLKAGGLWLVEMKWGGKSNYQRVEYIEVTPPTRLVWLHASSDADWNIIPSPMMTDWPRLLLTTVTFDARWRSDQVAPDLGAARGKRRPRSPALPQRSTAWARAGARVWSCSHSCWRSCRLERSNSDASKPISVPTYDTLKSVAQSRSSLSTASDGNGPASTALSASSRSRTSPTPMMRLLTS